MCEGNQHTDCGKVATGVKIRPLPGYGYMVARGFVYQGTGFNYNAYLKCPQHADWDTDTIPEKYLW